MKAVTKLIVLVVTCACFDTVHAEEIHAAVAANFTAPMKDIAAQYEEQSHHTVILSFGSSGKIFAQIQNDAPYDIFLSADQEKPKALEKAGATVPGSRFTYAIGALALWSAKKDFLNNEFEPLRTGRFNKLALANPRLAPYGAAAVEVMEALNLKQATESKWVMGENIAQTYQFIVTGNADLGFVAMSQIIDKGKVKEGSAWIVPNELYSPIRQDAVLLKRAEDSVAAQDFLNYLKSEKALSIIHSYGYQTE